MRHIKNKKSRRILRQMVTISVLSALVLSFQNCSQIIGFESVTQNISLSSLSAQSKFTCDPNAKPTTSIMPRLTKTQFVNSLQDILSMGLSTSDLGNLKNFFQRSDVVAAIDSFPAEGQPGKGNSLVYDTADQRISNAFIRAQVDLAMLSTQWIVSEPTRLSKFVNHFAGSACAGQSIANTNANKSCYSGFINGFGQIVLRRPVISSNSAIDAGTATPAAQNDLLFYEKIYTDASQGGFDALIAAMLLSPDSLFMLHVKGESSDSSSVTLSSYELASKISYYFTDSPPDEALRSAAAEQFSKPGNYISDHVERLFSSNRARSRLANFYTQWIRPSAIPNLVQTPDSPSTDLVELRANAIQEMVDLTEYYTFGKPNGKLSDIVTSDISFAKTTDLATIYGVSSWIGKNSDGGYDESALIRFDSSSPRAGLFTRAGYAFSGARDDNLIIRGSRIRKDYLCYDFSPPANFTLSGTVVLDGPPTVRNLVSANTSSSSCAACHKTLINPLGFALGHYDSFGRYRRMESIFDSTGKVSQSVPVDAHTIPFVGLSDTRAVDDGVQFSAILGSAPEFTSCFVRHYFRYTESRSENLSTDGCALQELESSLDRPADGSLKNMIVATAKSSSFKRRQINP